MNSVNSIQELNIVNFVLCHSLNQHLEVHGNSSHLRLTLFGFLTICSNLQGASNLSN